MYQSSNRYGILRIFFDSPGSIFQLRELSRIAGLGLPSVTNHVKALQKEGFLAEVKGSVYTAYKIKDSSKVRTYKKNDLLARIEESGLAEMLEKKFRPDCIVLYGSAVEGRDDERGDVDIYVQAGGEAPDMRRYEKTLNRRISLLFEPETGKLSKELLNSLANGITLKGFLKVVK
ncbi:MAG: winged helix-turn-helix transcriptional regulator [Candidatus Altiarchaeota archaeon]|nr:winged helix-turn-helix transcriptional regulator [Candidatus Altiarchaeota archaeon]